MAIAFLLLRVLRPYTSGIRAQLHFALVAIAQLRSISSTFTASSSSQFDFEFDV